MEDSCDYSEEIGQTERALDELRLKNEPPLSVMLPRSMMLSEGLITQE